MARLRQQTPQNYISSGNISAEFENLVRYLNAAERGNKTLAELLGQIFDEDGEFDGPIEMRLDSTEGLQFRVGEYTSETDGWKTIASTSSIRGPAGQDVGTIGAPILYGRNDYVATASQFEFPYAHDADDDLLVYVDGLLQVPGASYDYVSDATDDTITFNVAMTGGEKVTAFKVRTTAITGYQRQDFVTTSTTSIFPFVHDEGAVLQVYLNGILQRSGGAYDYVSNASTDTVTFVSPITSGNTVTILTVENTDQTAVTGLMMEENYTDPTTGLIPFSKLSIANNEVPQAKVSGLVDALASSARLTVSATTPLDPQSGDLWMDTSLTPNVLKFFNGTTWLQTSPESGLPSFTVSDAGKAIRVNPTGTGMIYADDDFSSLIPLTQKGAANGVATLDASGRMPLAQLPESLSSESIYDLRAGAVSNGTYTAKRIYKQMVELTGISIQLASGSCTIQLAVNGVGVGTTYAATSAGVEAVFTTAQQVDARTSNARIGYIVTSASSPSDLEVTIAASVLAI